MSAPLLASKLFVPQPPSSLVIRPQLLARLDEGMQSRLILLSAPPGFGKTTLLAQWIQQNRLPAAWISLDERDNDPARFLAYLLAALQSLGIDVGERALFAAQSPQPTSLDVPLTLLLNAASNHPQTFALVLDDYHVISVPSLHQAMNFLVDHLPANMHLVLATREDPPLRLARWRARGQLVELRAADLRMTAEQAATFLNQAMQLALRPEDIAKLESKTEGWVAALQMAGLSLKGQPNASEFVDSFSGSHRHILDYLADEVFSNLPAPVLDFLLSTSVVDRLCAPLCDALIDALPTRADMGLQSSQAMLEHLEAANVFLIPLDQERRWFRYHRLFEDILKYRLEQDRPSLIPELHRRAAVWLEQNDLIPDAIAHHLAAAEFDMAARLIEQIAPSLLWQRGEVTTLTNWLAALPEKLFATQARLALLDGWLKLTTVQLDEVERRVAQAERVLAAYPEPNRASMEPEIAVMRAMVSNFRGDLQRTMELSEFALARLPQENVLHRGIVLGNLGGAHASCGQVVPATRAFEQAAELGQRTGQLFLGLVSLAYLGEMEILRGQLHAAERAFQRALNWASEQGVDALPISALANVGMGSLLLEWNRLEEAQHLLEIGIAAVELQEQVQTGWGGMALLNGYLAHARMASIQGKIDQADEAIAKVKALAVRYMPGSLGRTEAEQARLWVQQGNLDAAARWAAQAGLSADDTPVYAREFEHLTLARVLIAQGRWNDAKALLDRLAAAAEADGRGGIVIEAMLLQALASQVGGEPSPDYMEKALARAEPEGYVRVFLDEGAAMAELLRRMRDDRERTTRLIAYAKRLLDAFRDGQQVHPTSPIAQPERGPLGPSVDSLSERELEVLSLVALGLSNQEIADKLVITVPTVKKHLSNIFGKLGVTNRTLAVAKGREMGLI